MKISDAIETLKLHAQDYAAPQDLRDAIATVEEWYNEHRGVNAKDVLAVLRRSTQPRPAAPPAL